MKCWQILYCAWFLLAPAALRAQDVRVRLYTNHAPNEIVVKAVEGELRWRTCPTCEEHSGTTLAISGSASKEENIFQIEGRYELRPLRGPVFGAGYPLKIEKLNDRLLVTVTMPLEKYVAAVLAAESGDFKNDESMKAMAVAVRTYALRFEGQHEKDGFDFCDTTHCQVVGWKGGNDRIAKAVVATRGETLQFAGKIAETYYHANCGGTTAAAKEAWPTVKATYLNSHSDSYCTTAGGLKWQSTIAVREIDRVLREAGLNVPKDWKAMEIAAHSESGRVQRLQFLGGISQGTGITGSTFRFAIDRALGWNKIRSDLYEVRNNGEQIIFSGHGSGHGVGLCQAGAEEMAREGKPYREILSFYYPGTQIGQVESGEKPKVQWQKRSSEHIDLLSMQADYDASILNVAERTLKEDEAAVGWTLAYRPTLKVFATMDTYRDTTGQPGWVASSTRARTIRLQPLKELQRRSIVESTLRHELLHLLIEARAKSGTPLWFREGLVLFFSAPNPAAPAALMTDAQIEAILRQPTKREEVEKAYQAAQARVAMLVQQNGRDTVLGWLSRGIPREISGPSSAGSAGHN